MGIAERRERDRGEMRRLILDTALELYKEEGFDHVTIRRITERMEYSPRTIYLYFKDKDEILFALHERGFDELYKRQLTLAKIVDPAERLHIHGRLYVDFAAENPELYDLMFIARQPGERLICMSTWEMGQRSLEVLIDNVQACMNGGCIPQGAPEVAAFAIWSFVHGLAALIVRKRVSMIPENIRPEFYAEVLRFMKGRILSS
jgi:AcrR family transcriptional regulator